MICRIKRVKYERNTAIRSGKIVVVAEYQLDEGFAQIGTKIVCDRGEVYKPLSPVVQYFSMQGIDELYCHNCGRQGEFFALERTSDFDKNGKYRYQYVLYTRTEDGYAVRLEVDHRIPLSRGGVNEKSNYQILCRECNVKKGDSLGYRMGSSV